MLTTDDDELAARARRLRWMGISTSTYERNYEEGFPISRYKWDYSVDEIGFKSNMHDISAAIGLVQLRRLADMQDTRRLLVALYETYLEKVPGIKVFEHVRGSSYHLMLATCDDRDTLFTYLREHGVSTGVHYRPIHTYKCYGMSQHSLPITESVWKNLITLPLYPDLDPQQVRHICTLISNFYNGRTHWQEGT